MTQRTTHEIRAEVQGLLYQINQALLEIERPTVEINDEGTGIITHPRDSYLGCVKEICGAIQDEEIAEIIVSRCV